MARSVALLTLLVSLHPGFGLNEVRWCATSDLEMTKCTAMKNAFAGAKLLPALSCVRGSSASDCTQMISANMADAVTLNGDLIYQAGKLYNLKPVAGEVYDQGVGTSYYAVAVVHKSSTVTINNLKGAKSCHTGIRRTAGWNVPIGWLTYSGQMPVVGCDFEKAASDFFSQSCVPGANKTMYSGTLCGLCHGSSTETQCQMNQQERYYDYSGAFRCLSEGAGDVAFVKHSTVAENTDGRNPAQWASNLLSGNFSLLCQNGSLGEVTDWKKCHLAKVPARAVMARQDSNASIIFGLLNEGQKIFHDGSTSFKMFDSAAYGGTNLLFKDSTTELTMITNPAYQAWLGDKFTNAMKGLYCDPMSLPESLRWCTFSTSEIWKCSKMAVGFKNMSWTPSVQCVSASTKEQCMKMIQDQEADAVTLGGQDIYLAGKTYGLIPAAGEKYSDTDNVNSYYAVAVVKKSSQNSFTVNELKGKRSCHTGYGRTAGWNITVGILTKMGVIRPKDCNYAKAVGEFFSQSCVPGAKQNGFPSALCGLCKEGPNKCENNDKEIYSGYTGAFRCLVEAPGDVAFVKHSTVFENTNGNNTSSWASKLNATDFQLLCLNGARAEVHQFESCNWGLVPARAVMVRPDTNIHAVSGLLQKAGDYFTTVSTVNRTFSMFESSSFGGKDLIFKDATEKIVTVAEKDTYKEWLGKGYLDSLEGMQCTTSGTGGLPVSVVLLLMSSALLLSFHF
ncbi:melanotransferrin [Ambystoma mexicanum]|uniref:melanotransferrin n=1 Tax=Ambystoma mexicanum TaxID=8296 RepID=UPI0037E77A1B